MTTELADDCFVEGPRDELDVDDASHIGRG